MSLYKEHLSHCERELAELALTERGDPISLNAFRRHEVHQHSAVHRQPVNYEHYGLIPIHRDVESWIYVSQDQQLRVAIEEVVNTFSPALSVELLLYNVLGSNSDFATCLVHYLVRSYSANQAWAAHIKMTLRNMIRWSVLAGFTPCLFLPWAVIRRHAIGLSGKASVTNLLFHDPFCGATGNGRRKGQQSYKKNYHNGHMQTRERARPKHHGRSESCLYRATNGLSPPQAAFEAIQEQEAHDSALALIMNVPMDRLVDTLQLLMKNSVPEVHVSVVCQLIADWLKQEPALALNPIKQTELKMASVSLWSIMKTFEHGRCPVIPECIPQSCVAFYDTKTNLVTCAIDGVLYRHISTCDSERFQNAEFSSLAKRACPTVRNWSALFHEVIDGLKTASSRHVYTSSSGLNRSSLAHLADVIVSSREEQSRSGFAVPGNTFSKPSLDNLSRFLVSEQQQPDMFGLNALDLPNAFLRSGVGGTISEHKYASVSHSLREMMASMISEGKELLAVRHFLNEVTRQPRIALSQMQRECSENRLLRMAENIVLQLERSHTSQPKQGTVTELGSDVRLVCSYPSSVSVAHLEEILSLWTNFWRSALSGFSQFSRRHNAIQYNNRNTIRDSESGSPVHVFHCMLVTLLNTSGVLFADSLSGRRPDASLTVNEIMLTRDSLHPSAYGVLLANKLGLRPSDIKAQSEDESVRQLEFADGLSSSTLHDRVQRSHLGSPAASTPVRHSEGQNELAQGYHPRSLRLVAKERQW